MDWLGLIISCGAAITYLVWLIAFFVKKTNIDTKRNIGDRAVVIVSFIVCFIFYIQDFTSRLESIG